MRCVYYVFLFTEDVDFSLSPRRRSEVDTTETETDDSDREDFPTEGLLKELHFLNARYIFIDDLVQYILLSVVSFTIHDTCGT